MSEEGLSYDCQFAPGGWEEDWAFADRRDLQKGGRWIQKEDCIENDNPEHAGIVLRSRVSAPFKLEVELAFLERMAPLLVLAPDPICGATEWEYREQWEVVLWDRGINVWHQAEKEGTVSWKRVAFFEHPMKAGQRHCMKLYLEGDQMVVQVGKQTFGFRNSLLPSSCYLGLSGCEGINRFYSFRVKPSSGTSYSEDYLIPKAQ